MRLREEHVHVERRPVDRPASEDDFRERAITASAVSEEAVVSKRARVIEEVVLSKEVSERTETVRDTVRRTDIEIEELNAGARRHYDDTFVTTDYDYDQYRPAYSYGHDLASHESYRSREWHDVEPEARRTWEATPAPGRSSRTLSARAGTKLGEGAKPIFKKVIPVHQCEYRLAREGTAAQQATL